MKAAPDSLIYPTGGYFEKSIAVDTLGNVHMIWSQCSTSPHFFWTYYQRSTDWGQTWSPLVQFNWPESAVGCAVIAADGLGDVHVIWLPNYNEGAGISYRRSTDRGQTWLPDTILADPRIYGAGAGDLNIVSDVKGIVHVLWNQGFASGTGQVAYKRSSDGGATWSRDTFLTNNTNVHTSLSLALDNEGRPHICWWEYPPLADGKIWYQDAKDVGLTWNPPILIADNDSTLPGDPSIAVDGLNRVYVFFTAYWWTDTIEQREIVYRVSVDTGKTFGPRQAMTLYPRIPFRSASVTGDIFGGVHAVWPDQWGDAILYNGSTDGGRTWRYDPPLAIYDSLHEWYPSITSDSRGRVHLAAEGYGSTNLYYGVYRSGYPLGVEENRQGDKETRGQGERLRATPNPFTSFARIPGHSSEHFALYDITGRRVGTYNGDRIGEGLAAGVYFLRSEPPTPSLCSGQALPSPTEGGETKPLRVVKLR